MLGEGESTTQGTDSGLKVASLYEVIRNNICLLVYPPGMALREEALAAEYGVSRTPIRHVLQRLEYEGLVTHGQGTGVIVTTIDLKSLKEVYELRLKLAEFVGEMMSSHMVPEVLQELDQVRQECESLRNRPLERVEIGRLYHRLHTAMLMTISNGPLRKISDQLFHQTARVWLEILPDLNWEEEINIILDEIEGIMHFLEKSDMQQVAAIRRKHMSLLLQRINRYLGSADNQPI